MIAATKLSHSSVCDTDVVTVNTARGIYTVISDADGWDRTVTPAGLIYDSMNEPSLPEDVREVLTWFYENI